MLQELNLSKEDYSISTCISKLDTQMIHHFLSHESTWSHGIPIKLVQQSIDNSLNFGLYKSTQQIGYARIVSDFSTIAYLGDVFILKPYRKQGLSKWLMDAIMNHPNLQGLRRWILLTSTAEGLYRQYGFDKPLKPEIYMEKFNSTVYKK